MDVSKFKRKVIDSSTRHVCTFRSSHRRCSIKTTVRRNFAGKNCRSFFLIKLQPFKPTTLLKRGSNTGVFL